MSRSEALADIAAGIAGGVASVGDTASFGLKEANVFLAGALTWEGQLVFAQTGRVRAALHGPHAAFTSTVSIAIAAVEEPRDAS
jgi:hypothetical protein